MNSEIIIGTAENKSDLEQILKLQSINHVSNFTLAETPADGFLTVKHDLHLLTQMNNAAKQILAKDNEQVVGYALAMLKDSKDLIPVLYPMFDLFDSLTYDEKKLNELNYYVMGQVCVDKDYRGKGLFNKLYQKHKEIYSKQFNYSVTEVAVRNKHSMKAHEGIGFKTIHTYNDETDLWNILLWDWS